MRSLISCAPLEVARLDRAEQRHLEIGDHASRAGESSPSQPIVSGRHQPGAVGAQHVYRAGQRLKDANVALMLHRRRPVP